MEEDIIFMELFIVVDLPDLPDMEDIMDMELFEGMPFPLPDMEDIMEPFAFEDLPSLPDILLLGDFVDCLLFGMDLDDRFSFTDLLIADADLPDVLLFIADLYGLSSMDSSCCDMVLAVDSDPLALPDDLIFVDIDIRLLLGDFTDLLAEGM